MSGNSVWMSIITIIILASVFAVFYTRQHTRLRVLETEQAVLVRQKQESQVQCVAAESQLAEQAQHFEERVEQLQLAALVAREAAAIRNLDELMDTVVQLISRRFDFYHAGIFLLDEAREFAVLQAASSAGGRDMLAREHQLRVGAQGIVGYVAARGEARIALDVGADAVWFNTPELPDTRSELALPLKGAVGASRQEQVIGVLDVQSTVPEAFTDEDIEVLQTMADQLALAIQNARLFEENRRTLERLEVLYRKQMEELWRRGQVAGQAYVYDGFSVQPLPAAAVASQEVELPTARRLSPYQLNIPILLREQMIGNIVLERNEVQAPWSDEEVALVGEVAVQAGLALENAQLLADSRQRANRQQQLSDISRHFSSSVDMDAMLRVAVRELGRLPGVAEASVHIAPPRGGVAEMTASQGG